MKKSIFIMLLASFAWILTACNTDEGSSQDGTLEIYTTVYPLQDFAEKIGGEYVSVKTVYPPGSDEHTFEPSQQDMIKLAEADLFFYIGLGLEGFVNNATDVLQSQDLVMVPTADTITDEELEGSAGDDHEHAEEEHAHEEEEDHAHEEEEHAHENEEEHTHEEEDHAHEEEDHAHEDKEEHAHEEEEHAHEDEEEHAHEEEEHAHEDEEGHAHEDESTEAEGHEGHNHGDVDPHVWLDPVLSKSLAESVKDSLIEAMPEQEEYFTQNFEELTGQLDELDHKFEDVSESAQLNQIFVSHAAYSYWETRYGIEQNAIAGISTSDEPSQRELTKMIELARENNIEHILFEQNVSSNLTEVIQKEIGAESLQLHNLSVLTQKDINNEEDYFSLMDKNIEALRTALKAE